MGYCALLITVLRFINFYQAFVPVPLQLLLVIALLSSIQLYKLVEIYVNPQALSQST